MCKVLITVTTNFVSYKHGSNIGKINYQGIHNLEADIICKQYNHVWLKQISQLIVLSIFQWEQREMTNFLNSTSCLFLFSVKITIYVCVFIFEPH